jgi:hypothetical protein
MKLTTETRGDVPEFHVDAIVNAPHTSLVVVCPCLLVARIPPVSFGNLDPALAGAVATVRGTG